MSEVPVPQEKSRPRLVWTLLGAMVLVGLVPLVISHYFLIDINRESLETLEKKYLTRSAVSIATDIQNLLTSNTQQLNEIAGSLRIMQKALPKGTDPFTYAANTPWIGDYVTPDSDLLALRVLNAAGQGAEAKPAALDRLIVDEMDAARQVAQTGRSSVSTFQFVPSVGQPAVVIGVPVSNESQVIGTVVGLVSLRRIADRIHEEGKG